MRQPMPLEEELSHFLGDISGEFVIILDNADELLESGAPNMKEDFINLLEVILSQFKFKFKIEHFFLPQGNLLNL